METGTFNNATWSAKIVKTRLGIDEAIYSQILDRLHTKLDSMGLRGQRLNTTRARDCLRPSFTDIYSEFSQVFDGVPSCWKDRCLLFLAQRTNYNKRRRARAHRRRTDIREEPRVSSDDESEESDERPSSSESNKCNDRAGSICHTILYINTTADKSTICTTQDVQKIGIHTGPRSIDDLDFKRFMLLIKNDLGYNEKRDTIIYARPGLPMTSIANERQWKAAMVEMVALGVERFSFSIKTALVSKRRPVGDPMERSAMATSLELTRAEVEDTRRMLE